MIRPVGSLDAEAIASIYNYYILNTIVTFEEQAITAGDIRSRIDEVGAAGLPWLVAEDDGRLVGYAYASQWKGRRCYRYSVEVTVYLCHAMVSRGWGTRLYRALFAELKKGSVHVVIGGVSLPNPASVGLHEKLGMEKVAHFREVGFKFDQWVDVGYWQKQLNDIK